MTPDVSVYTDLQSFSALRKDARERPQQALGEVAEQFEALFLQMMLKSMRSAGGNGGGILDSEQSLFYRDMFDQQLALTLAQDGRLGLAKVLVQQLDGAKATSESLDSSDPTHALPRPTPTRARETAGIAVATAAGSPVPNSEDAVNGAATVESALSLADGEFHPSSPDAFIQHMLPHAEAAASDLGVSPALLIAQAALETGWGRAVPTHADGRSSFNLFGIKADARWHGERVANTTLEFVNGLAERRVEPFRSYSSYAASFADYSDFLHSNPRYGEALQLSGDAVAFARALQRAGYATDPNYASKIENILASPGFDAALGELKSAARWPMNMDSG